MMRDTTYAGPLPLAPPGEPEAAARAAVEPAHIGRPPSRWTIGRVAPLVLTAWLLLDVGARFLPLEWFRIPPLLEAIRVPGRYAPFGRNMRLHADGQVGEAAVVGNLDPTEQRPPLWFTTDALGFRRNPAVAPGERPDVLFLLGASFTYGAALSDHETLPAAFTRLSGLNAYNAGRFFSDDRDDLRKLDWLLERLPARPRVAVLVHLDYETPWPPVGGQSRVARALSRVDPALAAPAGRAARRARQWLRYGREVAARWLRVSPVKAAATRLFKSVSDDRVLPNPYRQAVHVTHLPDGRPMLFRDYEMSVVGEGRTPADLRRTADYFTWWRDSLARRGIETYVLLLPTRYTLYGPWVKHGTARVDALRAASELNDLDAVLRARGIRTVNGLAVFGPGIEHELRTGDLSFYREDNHWNARGVERMARAVASALAGQ